MAWKCPQGCEKLDGFLIKVENIGSSTSYHKPDPEYGDELGEEIDMGDSFWESDPAQTPTCNKCSMTLMQLPTRNQLLSALYEIRNARDHCAEHGSYPDSPHGPGPDQAFDDWAADLADDLIREYEGRPYRAPPPVEEVRS